MTFLILMTWVSLPATRAKITIIKDGMVDSSLTVSGAAVGKALAISARAGVVMLVVYISRATDSAAICTPTPYFFSLILSLLNSFLLIFGYV